MKGMDENNQLFLNDYTVLKFEPYSDGSGKGNFVLVSTDVDESIELSWSQMMDIWHLLEQNFKNINEIS